MRRGIDETSYHLIFVNYIMHANHIFILQIHFPVEQVEEREKRFKPTEL